MVPWTQHFLKGLNSCTFFASTTSTVVRPSSVNGLSLVRMLMPAVCFPALTVTITLSSKSSLRGVPSLSVPPYPLRGYGGNYSPHRCQNSKAMSRNRFSPRVSCASASRDSSSRSRYLDMPLWLLLYWIDLSIVSSGFIRRRSLLRLRNQILSFLDTPSGEIWEVHANPNKKGYTNA